MKYSAIVFDLDGTLINTLEDLMNSVNFALEKYNFPKKDIDEIRRFAGNGVKKLVYKSVMADGVLESFDLDEEKIDKEPVTEVIEYGTKVKEEPKKTETKKTDTKKKDTKKTDTKKTETKTTETKKKDTKKTETKTSTNPEKNPQSTKPNAKASYTSGKSNNYHDDGNGTVTTYSGKQLKYSKVVELKATAYTYSSNKKYNITASGAPVQVGIVAANKNTLKMGTKVGHECVIIGTGR